MISYIHVLDRIEGIANDVLKFTHSLHFLFSKITSKKVFLILKICNYIFPHRIKKYTVELQRNTLRRLHGGFLSLYVL